MRASVTLLSFPALVLALQAAPDIVPAGKGLPPVTNVLTPELNAHGLSCAGYWSAIGSAEAGWPPVMACLSVVRG